MPKMDFLGPQEAEKINEQKWKHFWWTPCIVAYVTYGAQAKNFLGFLNRKGCLGHRNLRCPS